MLFDLSSPRRKNILRVVYGFLALIFAVGFVGFGIGTEAGSGGLIDSIFGSDDSTDSVADQFKDQIEEEEKNLEENPNDIRAMLNLAELRASSGLAQIDAETGAPTEEGRQELETAIQVWTDYLATEPERPNADVAERIVNAYFYLNDAEGAAAAQRIVADAEPTPRNLGTLASFLYADFNFKAGDKAAEDALAETESPAERKQYQRQLDAAREQYVRQEKAIEKLPKGEELPEGAGLGAPLTEPGSGGSTLVP